MKQIFVHFLLVLIVTVSSYMFAFAQLNDDGRWQTDLHYEPLNLSYESYSKSDFDNAVAKLKFLQSQNLSKQNDEWSGDYMMFGSLDVYVFRWLPNAGFVEIGVYTCIPELRRLSYGSVSVTSNYVITNSDFTTRKVKNMRFVRVKWGEQRYLIQENRISEFYSYLAGYNDDGSDYIDEGYFWVHKDDVDKSFAGMPIFPAGYERLVKKPIKATVTKILKKEIKMVKFNENEAPTVDGNIIPYYESHTSVKLNAGSLHGIKRGMGFSPINSDLGGLRLKIVSVDKHSSTGIVVIQLGEDKQESKGDKAIVQMFGIGAKLSTSSIFQQPNS